MDDAPDTVRDYLKRPYGRVLTPDEEYGGYTAEILEFPGCVTEGDTAAEALENLETAAEAWIEAALNTGQEIPEPSDSQEYGGRIALRLPRSLHGRAIRMAEREGTSLNQFLLSAIAERVGAGTLYARLMKGLEEKFETFTGPATVHVYMQGPHTPFSTRGFKFFGSQESPANTSRSLVLHGPTEED